MYPAAIVTGIILGLMYVDKPYMEGRNVNFVNYPIPVKHDTVFIHDTIYKERTVVKWKYKRCCCCCCKMNSFGCERIQKDTVKFQ